MYITHATRKPTILASWSATNEPTMGSKGLMYIHDVAVNYLRWSDWLDKGGNGRQAAGESTNPTWRSNMNTFCDWMRQPD